MLNKSDKTTNRDRAIFNLIKEKQYEVISDSMRILIKQGDIITAAKVPQGYHIGDIILFNRNKGEVPPTVHRIVYKSRKKGRCFYKTKGDSLDCLDKNEICEDDIVGKVIKIESNGKITDPNTFTGFIYNYFCFFISTAISLLKLFAKKIAGCAVAIRLTDKESSMIHMHDNVTVEAWKKRNLSAGGMLEKIAAGNDKKIAEIDGGFGYSAIAVDLIRKDIDVALVDTQSSDKNYDIVLVSGMLASIKKKKQIEKFLNRISKKIKSTGYCVISEFSNSGKENNRTEITSIKSAIQNSFSIIDEETNGKYRIYTARKDIRYQDN